MAWRWPSGDRAGRLGPNRRTRSANDLTHGVARTSSNRTARRFGPLEPSGAPTRAIAARAQPTVTVTALEAIPFAITTSEATPAGAVGGSTKWACEASLGVTAIDDIWKVRA